MNHPFSRAMCLIAAPLAVCLAGCDKPPSPKPGSAPESAQLEMETHASKTPEVSLPTIPNPSMPPIQKQASESGVDGFVLKAKTTSLPRAERLDAIKQLAAIDTEASTRGLVDLIWITASDDEDKRATATSSVRARYPAIAAIKKRGTKATPILIERLLALVATGGDDTEIQLVYMTALSLDKIDSINEHLESPHTTSRYPAHVISQARTLLNAFAGRFPQNK